jgi:hypothetical protein
MISILFGEFNKLIHRRKTWAVIIFFIALLVFDLLLVYFNSILHDFFSNMDAYGNILNYDYVTHPAMAAFLSADSEGQIAQYLVMLLLPGFVLFLYGDQCLIEVKAGYNNAIYTKLSKIKYFTAKLMTSFISVFAIMCICILSNLAISVLLFHGGQSFTSLEEIPIGNNGLLDFSLRHIAAPYLWYAIYALVFCFSSAFCCVYCTALAFIIKKKAVLYPVCFAIWFVLWMNPSGMSIGDSFLPFGAETGFYGFIVPIISLAIITVVCVSIGVISMKKRDVLNA